MHYYLTYHEHCATGEGYSQYIYLSYAENPKKAKEKHIANFYPHESFIYQKDLCISIICYKVFNDKRINKNIFKVLDKRTFNDMFVNYLIDNLNHCTLMEFGFKIYINKS
jgi:hypothetical protein